MKEIVRRIKHGLGRIHEAWPRLLRRGAARILGTSWDKSISVLYAPQTLQSVLSVAQLYEPCSFHAPSLSTYGSGLQHDFQSRSRVLLKNALLNTLSGDVYIKSSTSSPWLLVSETSEWPSESRSYYAKYPRNKNYRFLHGRYGSGHLATGYFHKLSEDIPSLMSLSQESVVLTNKRFDNGKFVNLLSQKEVLEVEEEWIQLEEFEFISKGEDVGYLHPSNFEILRSLRPKPPGQKQKHRLLLSRANQRRSYPGEKELSLLLKDYGFETIDPSNLSWSNQIDLFSNVEYVIAAHGGAITNVVFGTKVKLFELMPLNRINRCFEWQSYIANHEYKVYLYEPENTFENKEVMKLAKEFFELW